MEASPTGLSPVTRNPSIDPARSQCTITNYTAIYDEPTNISMFYRLQT